MGGAENSSPEESDSESEITIGSGRGGRPGPLCGARERRKLRACGAIDCLSSGLLRRPSSARGSPPLHFLVCPHARAPESISLHNGGILFQ